MGLTHGLVIHAAAPLRQPVIHRGCHREYRSRHHHVVEVRYDEVSVVILKVCWSDRQHKAGEATQGEEDQKSDAEQHRRLKAQRTTPHG